MSRLVGGLIVLMSVMLPSEAVFGQGYKTAPPLQEKLFVFVAANEDQGRVIQCGDYLYSTDNGRLFWYSAQKGGNTSRPDKLDSAAEIVVLTDTSAPWPTVQAWRDKNNNITRAIFRFRQMTTANQVRTCIFKNRREFPRQ